jgi:hypothetical protein
MTVVAFDLNAILLDPSILAEPLGGDDDARGIVSARSRARSARGWSCR